MGIDIVCDTESFSCTYSTWNEIRNQIIDTTYEYIKNIIVDGDENPNDLVYKKIIDDKFFIINQSKNKIDCLINCSYKLEFIDGLINFNIGGLYALCNKNDCEGYYSVGNSYDICGLFKIIKPYLIKYPIYNNILNIELVFQESVNIKQKIIIC